MNQIQKELKLSKEKLLKPISDVPGLVELSIGNVAIVEAMIQNDSAYIKSGSKEAAPTRKKDGSVKYGGSTAYWMTQLKPFLGQNNHAEFTYEEIISKAVESVDRENSTHLNADKTGRAEITTRILNIKNLKNKLKNANLDLIETIAAKTSAKTKARANLSFASKFCHYACFYLFEGLPEQDNYSIYDNVVKKILQKYVNYYHLPMRDLDNYKNYQKTIDEIITQSKSHINRNGFDHLLWYYFKGRI